MRDNVFALRNILWLGFFAAILWAWWALYAMARMSGVDVFGRTRAAAPGIAVNGGEIIASGQTDMASFTTLAPMWAVMMAAMMLPTMVPTLRAYEDLMLSANGSRAGWLGLIAGYMTVWVAFAVLIAAAQVWLAGIGMLDAMGAATSLWLAGGLLIGVGAFQFSRTKDICHGVCHAPTGYFIGHWRPGAAGGLRMGLALGAYCVVCCWGFMVLGFTGGVMSLLWMGAATLFMVVEKLPQLARFVVRPAGVVLIVAGLGLCLRAGGIV